MSDVYFPAASKLNGKTLVSRGHKVKLLDVDTVRETLTKLQKQERQSQKRAEKVQSIDEGPEIPQTERWAEKITHANKKPMNGRNLSLRSRRGRKEGKPDMQRSEARKPPVGHHSRASKSPIPRYRQVQSKGKVAHQQQQHKQQHQEHHNRTRRRSSDVGVLSVALDMDEEMVRALDEADRAAEEAASQYLQAFERFDTDGSGSLSSEEVTQVLRALGIEETDFEEIMTSADADGDGSIDYEEFVSLMKTRKRMEEMKRTLDAQIQDIDPSQTDTKQNPISTGRLDGRNLRKKRLRKKRRRSGLDSVESLREELSDTQAIMSQLEAKVNANVQWVQENCNVTSLRAQLYCKRWGMQKLQAIMRRIEYKDVMAAWKMWKVHVAKQRNEAQVAQYMKLKGSRRLTSLFANWKRKQSIAALNTWLRVIEHERTMERLAATLQIQRVIRGFLGRLRASEKVRSYAALQIQRTFRGHQGRERAAAKRVALRDVRAATYIQRCYRGYAGKKLAAAMLLAHRENTAATKVQALWRARRDRAHFADILKAHLKRLAATNIQRVFRGFVARQIVAVRQQAIAEYMSAVIIQAQIRGYQGRIHGFELMETRMQLIAEDEASLKIQACFRGYRSRRQVLHMRQTKAAVLLQKTWRGHRDLVGTRVVRLRNRQRSRAAVKIQQIARGYIARKHVNKIREENVAARHIQRIRRGQIARRRFQSRKEAFAQDLRRNLAREQAATRIQALGRGYLGRKRALSFRRLRNERLRRESEARHVVEQQEADAATKLQALQRGRVARKAFEEEKRAAEIIRQQIQRAKEEAAATRIQSQFRAKLARDRVRKIHAKKAQEALAQLREQEHALQERQERQLAAIRMQSAWRSKQARDVALQRRKNIAAQQKLAEEEAAALKIQNRIRSAQAKKETKRRREKRAKLLQEAKDKNVRSKLELEHRQEEAAVHIQSFLRQVKSRREARKLRQKQAALRHAQLDNEKRLAAAKIQAMYRAWRDRKFCKRIKWERENQELMRQRREESKRRKALEQQDQEEHAALKIQSLTRARVARKEVEKRRASAMKEKMRLKALEEERRQQRSMEEAALRIQCAFRTRQARRKMQERVREHQARLARIREESEREAELLRLREEQERDLAAIKVQSLYRAKAARLQTEAKRAQRDREFEVRRTQLAQQERELAASKIQAVYRGFRDRRALAKSKETARPATTEQWVEYWDENSQAYYYYNTVTGEASWTDPRVQAGYETVGSITDYDTDNYQYDHQFYDYNNYDQQGYDYYGQGAQQQDPATAYENSWNQQGAQGGATEEWLQYYDDTYQAAYYYNQYTGETAWEAPSGFVSKYADPTQAPRYG